MRWTLRRKILFGYGVVLVLAALVFMLAFVNLLRLGTATDSILNENYRSIIAAENMIEALERQDSGVLLYILGFEVEGQKQFSDSRASFSQWLGRARDNVTIEGEQGVIQRIDTAYISYVSLFYKLPTRTDRGPDSIRITYHDQLLPAFESVRDACAALRDLNERTMNAASRRASLVSSRAMWSTAIVGLFTLVLGLVFSIILSNRLVRPIRLMRDATVKIAEGDYEVEMPQETADDLGLLSSQFNEMAAQLRSYRDLNVERIVAEQKKSETVIQSIDDGLIVVTRDLLVEDLNPAAARALGIERARVLGVHLSEILDSDELVECVQGVVNSGGASSADERKTALSIDRNQAQLHFEVVITPIYALATAPSGVILLLRDVTHLKELDRLKSEFVATASHQLKTPLTSIGMSIGLLQERAISKLDDREHELLSAAGEDVERLRKLVNDLLDLSRIESGRIDLEVEVVHVSVLFARAALSLRSQAEDKRIALVGESSGSLPKVRADADKIIWVLTNLISNAIRHTDPGGRISLSAEAVGSAMEISVEDDGEGIPYAVQSKIFDKFTQFGGRNSDGGSGLGLAICKEIVGAHGGVIRVRSKPGVGARFTFTLPLATESH